MSPRFVALALVVLACAAPPLATAGPVARPAVETALAAACMPQAHMACEQTEGDYGFATLRLCRYGSSAPNLLATAVHTVGTHANDTSARAGAPLCETSPRAVILFAADEVDARLLP